MPRINDILQVGVPTDKTALRDYLAARESDVVSILDYGADPTGATASDAALIAAGATGKEVRVPPGSFLFNNPDALVPGGLVGAGARQTTITLQGASLARIDSQKFFRFGGFTLNIIPPAAHAITIGSAWNCEGSDIYFAGQGASAFRVGLSLGSWTASSAFGCQNNIFQRMVFENCDLELVPSGTYVNQNSFRYIQMMPGTSCAIYNGPRDAHGNVFSDSVFQTCRDLHDYKGQGNLIFASYLEECRAAGSFEALGCVLNGSEADFRSRADRVSWNRIGTTQTYDNGARTWLTAGPPVFKHELSRPIAGGTVGAAATGDPSVTGYKTSLIASAGSYAYLELVSHAEIADMLKAYGAVTVSWDGLNPSSNFGAVEAGPGFYTAPSMTTPFWQRYTRTITAANGFLRVYASGDGAGHIEVCNVCYGPGHTALLGAPVQDSRVLSGAGSPEGAVAASPGTMYVNLSGGAGTTLYVKESGSGSTGWVAK